MKVYHISYSPQPRIACLHFWGCNLSCRGCLCHKEIWDCHLEETKEGIFDPLKRAQPPRHFLGLGEIMDMLCQLRPSQVIFMGAEASLDRQLPQLARMLHQEFRCHNILLTNGVMLPSLADVDEVVFSIKAVTDSLHRDYTGKSNRGALENFVTIYRSGIRLRAESILIPGYIDRAEIENIAQFIASVDRAIPYRIDAYIPVGDNPWRRPTLQEMEEAAEAAGRYLEHVSYLSGDESLKYEVIRIF